MYEHHWSVELPIANYMEKQTEVTSRCRAIVANWVIEVQQMKRFNFEPETLYLIVRILDCFLGKTDVSLDDLQLVALGALFLGTKYEEVWYFSVDELVGLSANAYDGDQVSKAYVYVHSFSYIHQLTLLHYLFYVTCRSVKPKLTY